MNEKVMSNSMIQDLFNEITQYDVKLEDNENLYSAEIYAYDTYINFWDADDWEQETLEKDYLDATLPPKKKLVRLFLENPQFKEHIEVLAIEIVNSFIEAFEDKRSVYRVQKESDEDLVRKEAERNSDKNKLIQSLSNEQREALQKVFSISL